MRMLEDKMSSLKVFCVVSVIVAFCETAFAQDNSAPAPKGASGSARSAASVTATSSD